MMGTSLPLLVFFADEGSSKSGKLWIMGKKTSDIKAVFLVIIILKLEGDIFIKIKEDEKMIKGHVQ